ncbi:XRE family transcriptional regulator [Ruegeria sp.]|uniref:helix-turn-helix domain-containing protein n=1 Tax=Ruegeria sp. TaxID=1879320 RepID=UPI002308FB5F|nr:XRE family transcriptional regulator [Ruegeria sp.]MDA7966318.1 XRE family transcriptional regulator [Ruegeria sp.]
MEDSPAISAEKPPLDHLIGAAVKTHRVLAGLTLAELSGRSGVSTAMISKIERGQVSASLGTLDALARGIGVPLINFFAATVDRSDVSFVAAGEGVTVQRLGSGYGHSYKLIGRAEAHHVSFESFSVTLEAPLDTRPLYQHQGVEFIHVTEGEMIYGCGDEAYHMRPGDSLSFDSNAAHGPVELKTPTVTFVTVISKAISGAN